MDDVRSSTKTLELLNACRVPATVPVGRFGAWFIGRVDLTPETRKAWGHYQGKDPGVDRYTVLRRATMGTDQYPEVVMEDTLPELRRHLPILLPAHGRVLVSGLGLGCVVRGLLSKPEVELIEVVEIDPTILRVIGHEFQYNPRVRLRLGDALTISWPEGRRWDFAWHDVWIDPELGHLDVLHAQLMARYRSLVREQGAWMFDRKAKRAWPDRLLGAPGRGRQLEVVHG
jgi:hypothetical protein